MGGLPSPIKRDFWPWHTWTHRAPKRSRFLAELPVRNGQVSTFHGDRQPGPRRNEIRVLIAGLIKGNQWVFISPDHTGPRLFLGGVRGPGGGTLTSHEPANFSWFPTAQILFWHSRWWTSLTLWGLLSKSWESKGTPPMPPPPGNKALLRDY